MSLMEFPKFIINHYLSREYETYEAFCNELYDNGILTKDYPNEGLTLVYHKYDAPSYSELEMECRSLVLNRNTKEIVAYTCETPRLNNEGFKYFQNLSDEAKNNAKITTCYEGTLLSLFNHKDKWYLSTRRCLDSRESLLHKNIDLDNVNSIDKLEMTRLKSLSHFDMFEDVLRKNNLSFDDFTKELNKEQTYYFVLIHHNNKHLIDYSYLFGPRYSKLLLITVRDNELRELNVETIHNEYLSDYVDFFISSEIKDEPSRELVLNKFSNNEKTKFTSEPIEEGFIIKVWDNSMNKYNMIKYQHPNYQYKYLIRSGNINKGLLYLYQNDRLHEYTYSKPDEYSVSALITSLLKVVTSELFQLFKTLWSLKNGKHYNIEIYSLLPSEYKTVLFGLRGIYFKNKNDGKEMPWLKISEIFNFVKQLPSETFVKFLEVREKVSISINNDFYQNKVDVDQSRVFINRLIVSK